jgi:aarF domain-containing kinase
VYQRLNPLWKQKPLLAPAAAAAAGLSFSIISILRATPAHAYSENKHSKKMKPQEVITRTLTFWKRAAPIILHYKFTQTWLNLHHSNSNRCITNNNNDENAYATKFNWPSFPSLFQYYDQQKRDKIYEELHERYAPEALDIVLQMRGLFIKIGQVLSSRPDFIPEAYVNIMQTVQDDVPAWDASEIFDVIDKSWRRNFNLGVYDLLQEFDPEVLGSASIGQVHLGKLRKDVRKRMNLGKERELVAIKVMHLDAEDRFRNDFKIFKWLCRLALPGWTPILRELESQMMTEFDYIHEADNLEIVRKNMMASPYRNKVVVPQPLLEYCTPNVLIMEYLDGVKLESAILSDLTSALRGDEGLAKIIMEEKRRGM